MIIMTPSLSNSSVFKMFSVHSKTESRLFQIFPVWRASSKSSVFVKDYGTPNRGYRASFIYFFGVFRTGAKCANLRTHARAKKPTNNKEWSVLVSDMLQCIWEQWSQVILTKEGTKAFERTRDEICFHFDIMLSSIYAHDNDKISDHTTQKMTVMSSSRHVGERERDRHRN